MNRHRISFYTLVSLGIVLILVLLTGAAFAGGVVLLGISGTALTDDVAAAMNLPARTRGALILSITPGGPADEAGLCASQDVLTVAGQEYSYGGDIITAIQGKPVTDMDDLITYLVEHMRPASRRRCKRRRLRNVGS
jgi:S1-C subfamily serine protease